MFCIALSYLFLPDCQSICYLQTCYSTCSYLQRLATSKKTSKSTDAFHFASILSEYTGGVYSATAHQVIASNLIVKLRPLPVIYWLSVGEAKPTPLKPTAACGQILLVIQKIFYSSFILLAYFECTEIDPHLMAGFRCFIETASLKWLHGRNSFYRNGSKWLKRQFGVHPNTVNTSLLN